MDTQKKQTVVKVEEEHSASEQRAGAGISMRNQKQQFPYIASQNKSSYVHIFMYILQTQGAVSNRPIRLGSSSA